MREIKFRAWYGGTMIYDPVIYGSHEMGECWINDAIKDYDGILMQFTGLHDKNGNEIYEGDIVDFNGAKVKISWNCAEACFWGGSNKQRYITQYLDMCWIVGNIYENPELLEPE